MTRPSASGSVPAAQPATARVHSLLQRYTALDGTTAREIVLLLAARGSRLVVDRRASDGSDPRLLAHLAADEPDANAQRVCREYLASPSRRCRAPRAADLIGRPDGSPPPAAALAAPPASVLVDVGGTRYSLQVRGEPLELRWQRLAPDGLEPCTVSAREVVAALEDYEPVLALTRAAVAALRLDRRVSIATLALELRRLEASPIVLNRRLREAVLDAVGRRGVSLSAIAIACGRMKRDPRGNGSGETSWLARRVGLIADGGAGAPNPWVHSDTLALIARDGLGIAPRDVELG